MVWPAEPHGVTDIQVEFYYDFTWNAETTRVHDGQPITINLGRRARATSHVSDTSTVTLTFVNDDGRFNLRNPASPVHGKIKRGTPMRVRVAYTPGDPRLRIEGKVTDVRQVLLPAADGTIQTLAVVSCAGVLHDLINHGDLAPSALSLAFKSQVVSLGIKAYWPMEDGDTLMSAPQGFGSPVPGVSPLSVKSGATAGRSVSWAGSAPLPKIGTATLGGLVPRYSLPVSASRQWSVSFLMEAPPNGFDTDVTLLEVQSSGTAVTWRVQVLAADDSIRVQRVHTNRGRGTVFTSGSTFAPMSGRHQVFLRVHATSSGAFTWTLGAMRENTQTIYVLLGDSSAGQVGRVERVDTGMGLPKDMAMGHVVVADTNLIAYNPWREFDGFTGESIRDRVLRLVAGTGISAFTVPVPMAPGSQSLGAQGSGTLLELLRQATAPDGVLLDNRTLSLLWRSGQSRVGAPQVTIPFSDISRPFDPIDDDEGVVNDVTVQRVDGATARVEVLAGPLGVNERGRLPQSVTLNLHTDDQPIHQASFRAQLGTYDAVRLPQMTIDLRTCSPATALAVVDTINTGTRVRLTGLPASVSRYDLDVIIEGLEERLSALEWTVTYNLSPQDPYRFLVWDDAASRWDSDASTTAFSISPAATVVSVVTAAGQPRWAVTGEATFPFDVMIGGVERATVTGITGTTNTQDFTFVRGVNGYTRTHVQGVSIRVFAPVRWGL